MTKLQIVAVSAENLRGYTKTSLAIGPLTVLVGENNQGKSSLLKMLEWVMRTSESFWSGDRTLSDEDFSFWYPANETRRQARRLTIHVRMSDGRTARAYGKKPGETIELRFAVGARDQECRLNIGRPKRGEKHDKGAYRLLADLQDKTELLLLPPIRDGRSSIFAEKLSRRVRESLRKRLNHNRRAGAPREYRMVRDVLQSLREIVRLHSHELTRSPDSPLAAMLRTSEVRLDLYPEKINQLIEGALSVYLSTGDHDSLKVLPGEVGNGLQSLIDIGLSIEALPIGRRRRNILLVVEEPEAFLHPSAQRQFMQFLRRSLGGRIDSAILTTHSPIIVEECKYGEIAIVRDQRHFAPANVDRTRSGINSALITASAAEILFARTVCFVEGDGDKAFFGTLVRRIRNSIAASHELTGLVFQPTGGNKSFAPWLRMLRCYSSTSEPAFKALWVMDGDSASNADGSRPVIRLCNDCNFAIDASEMARIGAFGDLDWAVETRHIGCSEDANAVLGRHGGRLLCGDLEWALFNGASENAVQRIRRTLADLGISSNGSRADLARRLGSKIGNGNSSQGATKAAYVRVAIAEALDLGDLPPEIYECISQIFHACFQTSVRATHALREAGVAPSAD